MLLFLIAITFLFSYQGLKSFDFQNRYKFETDALLIGKEYHRIFSSALLHIDWRHFGFNMFSLYFFGESLIAYTSTGEFVLVYLVSILGSGVLTLYLHRFHGDYSAVGASGGVFGVVYAVILLNPTGAIYFWMIPIGIPSWLYGILYLAFTVYSVFADKNNICHEGHLGGAIAGLLMVSLLYPKIVVMNYLMLLGLVVVIGVFFWLIWFKPHLLTFGVQKKSDNVLDEYKTTNQFSKIKRRENEIDELLDKINQKGVDNLTTKEKKRLEELTKN